VLASRHPGGQAHQDSDTGTQVLMASQDLLQSEPDKTACTSTLTLVLFVKYKTRLNTECSELVHVFASWRAASPGLRAPLEFSRDPGARGDGVAARPLSGPEFGGYEEGSVFGKIIGDSMRPCLYASVMGESNGGE